MREIHGGHRGRLRKRFIENGIDSLSTHEIIEFLLCYSIPRKNTNETAHRLLEKFGSISNILDADIDELLSVEGVGLSSAAFLKSIPQILRAYRLDKNRMGKCFTTVGDIGKYLVDYYCGVTRETVVMLLFNNRLELIECVKIFEGSVNSGGINIRKLAEIAVSQRASSYVLAHNHPDGNATPSNEDLSATSRIRNALLGIDLEMIEHIIVGGTDFYPILHETFKRKR